MHLDAYTILLPEAPRLAIQESTSSYERYLLSKEVVASTGGTRGPRVDERHHQSRERKLRATMPKLGLIVICSLGDQGDAARRGLRLAAGQQDREIGTMSNESHTD